MRSAIHCVADVSGVKIDLIAHSAEKGTCTHLLSMLSLCDWVSLCSHRAWAVHVLLEQVWDASHSREHLSGKDAEMLMHSC